MASCEHEAISAFIDGELPEKECKEVMRRISSSKDSRQVYEHFCLVGSLLRGEVEPSVPKGLADQVAEAIASEPIPSRGSKSYFERLDSRNLTKLRPRWYWASIGVVGVIAVTVIGVTHWPNTSPLSPHSSPSSSNPSPLVRQARPPVTPTRITQADVATLQSYLQEHAYLIPSGPGARFQRTSFEVGKVTSAK